MAGHIAATPGRGTQIFLRDDDVSTLSPSFVSFFRRFADAGLPVSYQIIPETFTGECAEFLLAEMARAPGSFDLGQHGLRHQMIVRGKVVYYEFGPERSFAQQLEDILAGQAILRERLGEGVALEVFTPPRHRYDRNTLKAIRQAGYRVLSASSYTSPRHRAAYGLGRALGLTNLGRPGVPRHGRVRPDSGLFEISIAVGMDDGGSITATVDAVMDGVREARAHTADVGVLFHHEAFKGGAGEAFLDDLIGRLKELPDVSFHTIGQIYRMRTAAV